jgi:hypothetical protein
LNGTGLLSEPNALRENLLHLPCVVCTTIMRVCMTQIRVADAMHRPHNVGVTLASCVEHSGRARMLAAISSDFRHISAPWPQ